MAIALAKRYCRDDKFAMEWAEFLHSEVEKSGGTRLAPLTRLVPKLRKIC